MNKELLTKESGQNFKHKIEDWCGWMAGTAADEIFEDAWFHGKNQVAQLVDENDHLVIVVDSDCPDHINHQQKERQNSVITELCRQGVVVYYYHSIHAKHHHVCLAVRKAGAVGPLESGPSVL
ncbi:MAG: hypothetical protein Q8L35_06235 [Actinomycetota bacterium]|nr:hypothetical protein [Actinomycetota bacterium]